MSLSHPTFGAAIAATLRLGDGKFTATGSVNHAIATNFPVGSSSGQADTIYTKSRTVPSGSTPDSLTLSSLTDPAGNAVAFAHVVDLLVENTDTTNTLTLGGGLNPVAFLPAAGVSIPPGGAFILHVPAGLAITSGSADRLQISTSGGASVPYNVTILGRSA